MLGLALPLLASTAWTQKAGTKPLHGRVINRDLGLPIPGVKVRVCGTRLEAVTDTRGRFVFASVPTGHLTVAAEGLVIEPLRVKLDTHLQAGPLLIRAQYASRPDYAVTVVAAPSRPATASTSHVTARELAAVPHRNAEDALRLVPGFTLVQHGSEGKGHQFFLRGFDAVHGADLEVTVEGIPINEWSNIHAQGYIDLGFVIPEVIASVEVTKGPFTLEQGAFAMAGSADFRLGIAKDNRGFRSSYTIGTTNRHRGVVTYTPRHGHGKDFIAIEALHDDGFGQNRDINRGVLLGRIRLMDSPGWGTLSLLGSGHFATFSLPGTIRDEDVQAGRVGFYDAYDAAGRGLSGRGIVSLVHDWRTTGHHLRTTFHGSYHRLDLLENYTGFLIDPVNGDRRGQLQDAWSFGANVFYDMVLVEGLTLRTGLGARGDVVTQSQRHLDQQEAVTDTVRALEGFQAVTHALMGIRWRPVPSLRLAAGARLDLAHLSFNDSLESDQTGSGTLVAVSPRTTLQWRARRNWRLFAAYGRGFRPPEGRSFSSFEPGRAGISEDVYNGGEPTMTVADCFELGTRWTSSRYFAARLSGFVTWVDRESIFDHVSGVNLELNSTRRLGTELEIRSHPVDWLTLSADVTFVDARFVDSGNPIPHAPWLVGGARAVISHGSGFRAGLRFIGLAPRPLPHGAQGATMASLDATAGYRWRGISVDFAIENLLNQQIREGEYHYASHWWPEEEPSQIPVLHYVAGPPLNARLNLSAVF